MITKERGKLNLSENLSQLMRERGVTQLRLAAASGVAQSRISGFLHGRHLPNIVDLWNIAEALDVTMDQLVADPVSQRVAV